MEEALHRFSKSLEWLEEKTRPLFVIAALILYAISLYRLALEVDPLVEVDAFLVGALTNLSIPFGVILLQELLELIANIGESNLISARHQFEILVLVLVRSFFKKFGALSGYVQEGDFSSSVQEAVVKIIAIVLLMLLIYIFRVMSESKYVDQYTGGQLINEWKQVLVVILTVFVLVDMLLITGGFDDTEFIRLIFTGVIIIDALFLILAIVQEKLFLTLAFESSLIIALIFVRFPLFTTNTLSVILSVLGVSFATAALYLVYRVANLRNGVPNPGWIRHPSQDPTIRKEPELEAG